MVGRADCSLPDETVASLFDQQIKGLAALANR